MKRNALLCFVSVASVWNFAAADEVGRWYLTPQAGGLITDNDRHIEDEDPLFGLAIGKHISERWSVELNANGAQLDAFEPYAASLDALRVFRREQALSPYLTFGAGAIRNDFEIGSDDTDFMAQAGAGLMWKLGVAHCVTGSKRVGGPWLRR